MMDVVRVLVVDDHMLVRDGITSLLSNVSGLQVVALASNGQECISQLESARPDVVLMDVVMPIMNGIEACQLIREDHPHIKVILLSMEINEEFIMKGVKAGAKGYLPKDIRKNELIEALLTVQGGGTYFSSKVSELLLAQLVSDRPNGGKNGSDCPLSTRELEVLKHIATGFSNREIAEQLFISVKTVDAHRNNILRKLEIKSTAEMVKYAIKNQIVSLE